MAGTLPGCEGQEEGTHTGFHLRPRGARTWVPATLEPEAAVEDLMTFVLMDHDIERNASSDRDDVVEWHEAAVNEAKPRLRREQVFVVGDLALLEEEAGGRAWQRLHYPRQRSQGA